MGPHYLQQKGNEVELSKVIRRRRMVRRFDARLPPAELLQKVLESALHAPSAGFSQGLGLVVLDTAESLERFWSITDPRRRKSGREGEPPVVVVVLSDKTAYLKRYSEPDKRGLGMHVESGWPVPYWDLDAAMAVMLMLLRATDVGLGSWFFGVFHGEEELMEWLRIPPGRRVIGALGIGHPAPGESAGGSLTSRRRRSFDEVVHWRSW